MSVPVRCLIAIATLGLVAASVPGPAADERPLPLRAYRIRMVLATAASIDPLDGLSRRLQEELPGRIESLWGAVWQATVVAAPPRVRGQATRAIECVASDALAADDGETDKILLLAVGPAADGYQLVAREWDVRARIWNAAIVGHAQFAAQLTDAALRAASAAFTVQGTIEAVEAGRVKVRLRGSALAPRDPSLALLRPGDALQPVLRVNDAGGGNPLIVRPAWTLLRVEQISAERIDCRAETGLKGVEWTVGSGATETLVVGVARADRPTRLTLRSRDANHAPLVGYEVHRSDAGGKNAVFVGRTDRDGAVLVTPGPTPLEILSVSAGGERWAQLPIVPGAEAQLTATLPDAAPLLQLASRLEVVEDEAEDQAALGCALIARVKQRIREKRWADIDPLLRELKGLKSRATLAQAIAAEKKQATSDDPLMRAKLEARLNRAGKRLETCVPAEAIARLEAEVRAAQGK